MQFRGATKGFGDIPFLVACGNHDICGGGELAFDAYALPLAEKLVGRPDKGVSIDFYACDSITPLESFRLVGDMI